MGSVIVGSKVVIQRAIRLRKVLGGGMRQVGVLAAAGLYALDHNVARLAEDHSHAKTMADTINRLGEGRFVVKKVDSNLVIAWVTPHLSLKSILNVCSRWTPSSPLLRTLLRSLRLET